MFSAPEDTFGGAASQDFDGRKLSEGFGAAFGSNAVQNTNGFAERITGAVVAVAKLS